MNLVAQEPDWLIWQIVQVQPALDTEIRRLNYYRSKIENMLACKTLNAEQRRELTMILDLLAKRGIIYSSEDKDPSCLQERRT